MIEASTITLYGIPQCDQVKKARAWLTTHAIPHLFYDFKKAAPTPELIDTWINITGWEVLINRKGTTWRALDEARKTAIVDATQATRLMIEFSSVIKRPVLQRVAQVLVGFDPHVYQSLLNPQTLSAIAHHE